MFKMKECEKESWINLGYDGDFSLISIWEWLRINKGIDIEIIYDPYINNIDGTLKEMVNLSFEISLLIGRYLFGWDEPSYDYKFIGHSHASGLGPEFEGYSVLYEYTDTNAKGNIQTYTKTINYSFDQFNEFVKYKRSLQLNKIIE